jgi:enoyl-CoA hydratase
MSLVVFEKENDILKVALNRESVLNAINSAVLEELQDGLIQAAAKLNINVLMLYGKGRCFSAGADIGELAELDDTGLRAFHGLREKTFSLLEDFPCPTFAVIDKYALGTGLELALSCDFRIAGQDARLGVPSAGLAIVESYEYLTRLVRAIGIYQAKKIIFTSEKIDAPTAFAIGLVQEVVPTRQLFKRAANLVEAISKNSIDAMRHSKEAIRICGQDPNLSSVKDTALPMTRSLGTTECKNRLKAFLKKKNR